MGLTSPRRRPGIGLMLTHPLEDAELALIGCIGGILPRGHRSPDNEINENECQKHGQASNGQPIPLVYNATFPGQGSCL